MAHRFYLNSSFSLGEVVLEGAEAHHLGTVCRFRPGDTVYLFNGDGREYQAEIVDVDKRQVVLRVVAQQWADRELPIELEVAAALPKGDRGEFVIEKLTELGVRRFVPLRTAQTIVQPRESKLDRLQRTVIEASKQCGRCLLMEVTALTEWADYLRQRCHGNRNRWLAHPDPQAIPLREVVIDPTQPVHVAVGPEGGFRDGEVAEAVAAGWQIVSLGPRILRVETAAILLAGWIATRVPPSAEPER